MADICDSFNLCIDHKSMINALYTIARAANEQGLRGNPMTLLFVVPSNCRADGQYEVVVEYKNPVDIKEGVE